MLIMINTGSQHYSGMMYDRIFAKLNFDDRIKFSKLIADEHVYMLLLRSYFFKQEICTFRLSMKFI